MSHPDRDDRAPRDLVRASPSLWDEGPPPSPRVAARRSAARPPAPRRPEPPRRRVWPLVLGGVGVLGLGAAVALAVGSGGEEPARPATSERVVAARVAPTVATDAGPTGGADAAGASTTSAPTRAPVPPSPPTPPPRPAWAELIERTNPWLEVAPGTSGDVLGVTAAQASGPLADQLTGFLPAEGVIAPTRAYRLQQHEITWGELELAAADLPGLALIERPSWVPKDAARRATLPATGVPWAMARELCRLMGGHLPSEAEWEWAARGRDKRTFPWGDAAIDQGQVRISLKKPIPVAPVLSSPLDKTPGEAPIHDLLGNALEWTADLWSVEGAASHERAVRGWPLMRRGEGPPAEGSTFRRGVCVTRDCDPTANDPYTTSSLVGFRCAAPVR